MTSVQYDIVNNSRGWDDAGIDTKVKAFQNIETAIHLGLSKINRPETYGKDFPRGVVVNG